MTIHDFLSKYKKYIILISLLLVLFYIFYKLLYSVRSKDKIYEFENTFTDSTNKYQLDFCGSDKYNGTNLADYYVCSSYNPMSIGYLKYDYVSIDMIEKAITYGSRYIELEVLDFELKTKTKPVIGISNDEGYLTDSQNVLDCQEVFQRIADVAFSERYIDNYQDPLFIFLNIKTKNTDTLDQLYTIITNLLQHKLLDSSFNNQQINIATTKMCDLMNKIVILSSDGYEHSKLETIINLSTNNTYLRRIKWDELPHTDELMENDSDPIVSLISKNISFYENYISIDDNTNFLTLGVVPNTVLSIKGSSNPKNNSYDNLLHIRQVTPNRIILDTNIDFTNEDKGDDITLKVFSVNYTLKNLNKQNKSSLTIVYTHRDFFTFNYDPATAWNLGCQFVCMNFQKEDRNLKTYMKEFKKQSYILKPSNLRNVVPKPIQLSLNQQFPKLIVENNIPILQNFVNLYPVTDSVQLTPFSNKKNNIFVVNKNNIPHLSLNNTSSNSEFIIKDNSDNTNNTIQLQNGTQLLTSNSSCCYLSFKSMNEPDQTELIKYSSFYPVQALCNNDDYVSFLQIINNKKYYLKYRTLFKSENRLYKKVLSSQDSSNYNTIGTLDNHIIIEPKLDDDFKSIGHVLIDTTTNVVQSSFETIFDELKETTSTTQKPTQKPQPVSMSNIDILLLKGAVSNPIEFNKIWEDKDKQLYLWNPIAADGYISMGVVFTTTDDEPDKTRFCCVASEFLTETTYKPNPTINIENNSLNLWSPKETNNTNNTKIENYVYYKATTTDTPPSQFIYPIYNFKFEPDDYLDLLYIGKVESNELESACFKLTKLNSNVTVPPIPPIPITYKELKNKIMSVTQKNKCISLKDSYWSKENDTIDTDIVLGDCKDNDYWPTNFIYKNNNLILRKDTSLCLENNNASLSLSKCNKSDKQYFQYQDDYLINKQNNISKCLTINKKEVSFEECDFSAEDINSQKWSINQNFVIPCLKLNDLVYFKTLYPRAPEVNNKNNNNNNNNTIYNYLNEPIDETHFHIYVPAIITSENEKNWIIKLSNTSKTQTIPKNKNALIPINSNNNSNIIEGTRVLAHDGGLNVKGYENVMWEAQVIKVLKNSNIEVLFSINSIEANENRMDMGRPRINIKKVLNTENVIVLEPGIQCS